jgi:hypothetical protein
MMKSTLYIKLPLEKKQNLKTGQLVNTSQIYFVRNVIIELSIKDMKIMLLKFIMEVKKILI